MGSEPDRAVAVFEPGTVPEWTTAEWYASRDRAPHLEQDAHKARLAKTAEFVAVSAQRFDAPTVVDLGAGDGGLLSLLPADLKAWGYDLQPSNVEGAGERGVDVRYGDILGDGIEWARIAVATEVLEHLVDPAAFVRRVADHADVLVASSPAWENAESHYEFHTWAFDFDGYRELLEQGSFDVIRHEDAGGFQVAMGVRR